MQSKPVSAVTMPRTLGDRSRYGTPSRPEKEQRPQSSAGDDCRGHRIECFPTVKAAMCVNDVCQQVVHVMLS